MNLLTTTTMRNISPIDCRFSRDLMTFVDHMELFVPESHQKRNEVCFLTFSPCTVDTFGIQTFTKTKSKHFVDMANLTAAALANRNKKHFLGVPAPLGYVAGVGRGYVNLHIVDFTKNCSLI